MKSKPFVQRYWIPAILICAFSITLVAWDRKQPTPTTPQSYTDTVPKSKKDKNIRDLDDVLNELDRVDIEKEMQKAMKEMQESLKNLDASKMRLEIEKGLKEVDMEKVKKDMEKALKELDAVKIKQDLEASIAKIDFEKMKAEMEAVKKIDMKEVEEQMKKVKEELEDLGPKMKEQMEKAKVEIEKAKVQVKEYKDFVDGLDKDGLIDKKKEYSIEHKNGELIINGKKQDKSVYSRYRSFLESHKEFNIKKTADDFDMNIDKD